jgi:ribosomal protein S18 acetylase RimI-like enzyme
MPTRWMSGVRFAFPLPDRPVADALCPPGLQLRTACNADVPFLLTLYASVRAPELNGWTEHAAQAFVADQFRLQHAHYLRAHPLADYWIIDRLDPDDAPVPIGRLSLDRNGRDWHLIELSLLASERGRGRGSALLRCIQDAAEAAAASVDLHVELHNTDAIRLYARMGFKRRVSRFPTHALLTWTPSRRVAL